MLRLHRLIRPMRRAGPPSRAGRRCHAVVAVVGLMLAGCGIKALPESVGAAVGSTVHPEPPVEIYTRVARGALTCWFGAQGSLKATHVFHAEVAPPSAGGEAEISIQQRDRQAANPRSLRAYRISITRAGEGAHLTAENVRMPEAVAKDMAADIVRWARGDGQCSVVGTGGWAAGPTHEPPPVAAKTAIKGRKKP